MVLLHIKRGEASQFLFETNLNGNVGKLLQDILAIFNGRLKVQRICAEMEELANHGCMLPPDIIGLTDEQVEELKLIDPWADKCVPSGGWIEAKDPLGRRNGRSSNEQMHKLIMKSIAEAKAMIDKDFVQSKKCLVQKNIQEALDLLRGTVMIVYPMQLPPHDPIRMEFQNTEDLSGTQASLQVIEPAKAQLWFAGRQLISGKFLKDFLGTNEKTTVIIKLQKSGEGAPGREPIMTEDQRKQMMMLQYRRQEELKKLEQDDDHNVGSDTSWLNSSGLKEQMQGLGNINWKFGK